MITKKNLGEFDSIGYFDNDYLLVERKGLFNLMSFADGKYISRNWFQQITKHEGGGADFVVKENERVQTTNVRLFAATYAHVHATLNNTNILTRLDTRCITPVPQIRLFCNNISRYITMVAKVDILGKIYYLGKNGKLYTTDTNDTLDEYNLPEFFISYTDIARLTTLADTINKFFNSCYDKNNKPTKDAWNELLRTKTSCFIFGFGETKMFMTCYDGIIIPINTKKWSDRFGDNYEDTIKVRIDVRSLPADYQDTARDTLRELDFIPYTKSNKLCNNVFTKEYIPSEIDDISYDLHCLMDIKRYALK